MPVTPDDLLKILAVNPRRLMTLRELLAPFALHRAGRQAAQQTVERLIDAGAIERRADGRLRLAPPGRQVIGTVSLHRDGYGFLTPEQSGQEDIFIAARYLGGVMPGDKLAVQVERSLRGRGKVEGRVVRVVERAEQELLGRFEGGASGGYLVPSDPRLRHPFLIPAGAELGARPGEVVVARIERYPELGQPGSGRVVRVLGSEGDPEVEILTAVHKFGLPYLFSHEVLAAAERVPAEVASEELAERIDLRALPLVTIDGESARDFDDAVAARRESDGTLRLWVAIADVGHYVPEGGLIDGAARERGTSVYFPERCIPMLPERLSNGICSLNPEVDRLVLTAELLFGAKGERLAERFYPAVMRSRARLTYTTVAAWLTEPATADLDAEVATSLQVLAELATRLTSMRVARGSLDFDLPEVEIVLDLQGKPENILRRERNQAHRIIEECMLAANEAVATFLTARGRPLLYRIHEPPDNEKLMAFQQFVAHFNYGLDLEHAGGTARQLQRLLAQAAGKPEERMINQLLLRSMKQARYSAQNRGHFGLAADCYCHFTSPIRRYPDLQVHRALRQALLSPAALPAQVPAELVALGEATSTCERRAMEAERDVLELKKCQFMADKVGQTLPGIIANVQPFGIFVELTDYYIEGLVRITSLGDDYYDYDGELHRLVGTRRRRMFQIGDRLQVQVSQVDPARREIDFLLPGTEPAGPAPRRSSASKQRRQTRR